MKEKKCAVIACQPIYFPWGYDEEDEACSALKITLYTHISILRANGIIQFNIAMDSGAGLYTAELIRGMRETDPIISYDCYIPHEEQTTKWTPELRDRYYSAIQDCGGEVMISRAHTVTCELETLIRAVDSACSVIAVYGTDGGTDYNTAIALKYAELAGKTIHRISAMVR